jgi:hypothetical protein
MDERYMSATAFQTHLRNLGLEDQGSRTALTGSLHLLGDILCFQNDPELRDQVFLKPKWVSDLIVQVIESDEVVAGDGVLTRAHTNHLWSDVDEHIREHLIQLMERFDLSYRTPDPDHEEISLVVDAVPKSRPDDHDMAYRAAAARPGSRTIRLKYRFPALVAGVPTWFIARAHRFTTHKHWRTGAVFADDQGHMAMVTASEAERSVELEVCGPQPTYFLAVLKLQFEDTLRRYPGLDKKITIPCPGHDGAACRHEFDFDLLQKQLERRTPRYMVVCDVAAANDKIDDPEIDLREILYGLHPATMDQMAKDLQDLSERTASNHVETMGALRSLSQQVTHNHVIQWRARQSEINAICPAVFAIRRQNRSRAKDAVFGYRWKLHLYCEAPAAWHQTGHDGYPIKDMAGWLKGIAPHLGPLIVGLQAVAPLALPGLGVLSDEAAKALKHDLKLMQELVKKLPGPPDTGSGRGFDKAARFDPERSGGTALQQLYRLLREHAPGGPWGDLSKVLTPEGEYLWLCADHAEKLAR